MTDHTPLTDARLAELAQLIARTTPVGAVTASPGLLGLLLAEVRRQRTEVLEGRTEIAKLRDLLGAESERANAAIDREETAEQAALEAQQERDKMIRWHGEDGKALAEMRATIERLRADNRRQPHEAAIEALRSAAEHVRIGAAVGPIPLEVRPAVDAWLCRLAEQRLDRARQEARSARQGVAVSAPQPDSDTCAEEATR